MELESWLHEFAHYVTLAIVVIAIGAIEAVVGLVRVGMNSEGRREVWLRFARWLVAALTFQLAADVVNTSFDPGWDQIGHLAAIALIRTFLSFFLEREMDAKVEQIERARSRRP